MRASDCIVLSLVRKTGARETFSLAGCLCEGLAAEVRTTGNNREKVCNWEGAGGGRGHTRSQGSRNLWVLGLCLEPDLVLEQPLGGGGLELGSLGSRNDKFRVACDVRAESRQFSSCHRGSAPGLQRLSLQTLSQAAEAFVRHSWQAVGRLLPEGKERGQVGLCGCRNESSCDTGTERETGRELET